MSWLGGQASSQTSGIRIRTNTTEDVQVIPRPGEHPDTPNQAPNTLTSSKPAGLNRPGEAVRHAAVARSLSFVSQR